MAAAAAAALHARSKCVARCVTSEINTCDMCLQLVGEAVGNLRCMCIGVVAMALHLGRVILMFYHANFAHGAQHVNQLQICHEALNMSDVTTNQH